MSLQNGDSVPFWARVVAVARPAMPAPMIRTERLGLVFVVESMVGTICLSVVMISYACHCRMFTLVSLHLCLIRCTSHAMEARMGGLETQFIFIITLLLLTFEDTNSHK